MKNKIFNIFQKYFIEQIKAYALSNFPLQLTTKIVISQYQLIKVKKGKIRQVRLYDENHARIHNFTIASNGKIIINP